MVDMLKRGSEWLHAELIANAAQSVTYRRGTGGGASTVVISAVFEARQYAVQTDSGALIHHDVTDFIGLRSALDFGSGEVTPAIGDFILYTDDRSAVITYELNFPGDEHLFTPLDAFENHYLIHTKKV